jgi:hypothetical protein
MFNGHRSCLFSLLLALVLAVACRLTPPAPKEPAAAPAPTQAAAKQPVTEQTVKTGGIAIIAHREDPPATWALSFLGLGVPPPQPSWGGMLQFGARGYLESAPWLTIFPGLALSSVVFAFALFGDAPRDVLDPRLKAR